MITREEIIQYLYKNLSEKRVVHIINVEKMAIKLAEIHQVDAKNASISALLHDITKEKSGKWHLEILRQNNLEIPENENLYHAETGYILAKNEFLVKDLDILEGIKYHTIGKKNMSKIAKIIYISDYIEEGRMHKEAIKLRKNLTLSLDYLVEKVAKYSVEFLKKNGIKPHKKTLEIFE